MTKSDLDKLDKLGFNYLYIVTVLNIKTGRVCCFITIVCITSMNQANKKVNVVIKPFSQTDTNHNEKINRTLLQKYIIIYMWEHLMVIVTLEEI